MSMAALFRLRASEPALERPYRAPFYPVFPAISLVLAVLALVTMVYYNALVFGLFVALFVLGYLFYLTTAGMREKAGAAGGLGRMDAFTEARSMVD